MNIERLLQDSQTVEGQRIMVFSAVPEYFRKDYSYWRGIHMGKLAMHLAMGQSPVPDSSHFSEEFDYAARVARSLARGLYKTQWNEREDPLRFKQLFGKLAPAHFPALVCARTSHNAVVAPSDELRSGSSLLGPSEHPQARGVKIAHTSFADLDPHTQTFLTEYFDLT